MSSLLGRPKLMGGLLVTATLGATWRFFGVPVSAAVLSVGFEVLYVVLPGCILYTLLAPRSGSWGLVLAVGWPLGYALEIGIFSLTAALQARSAFTVYPLIWIPLAGSLALLKLRRHPPAQPPPAVHRARAPTRRLPLLIAAGAVSFALALLALESFAYFPLPGASQTVTYAPDNVYDITLAAEARHHWPITQPSIAGTPLRYYTGVFIHIAAVNQVTGIPIATVVLRLLPSTLLLIIGLQLWLLGVSLGGPPYTPAVSVVLFFVVEELNLDPTRPAAFGGNLFYALPGSPTYALGIVFYLGLLLAFQLHVLSASSGRKGRLPKAESAGSPTLLGALAIGAGATKMFAALDFVGGLTLFWLWQLARRRRSRVVSWCLLISAVSVGTVFELLLSGEGSASTFGIRPLAFVKATIFSSLAGGSVISVVPSIGAALIACCFLFTPLLGAAWLLRKRSTQPPVVALSIAMFLFGLAAYAGSTIPYFGQVYFLSYGYLALIPVAALGLTRLLAGMATASRKLAVACCVTLLFGLVLSASTKPLLAIGALNGRVSWCVWYLLAYGLILGLVSLWGARLDGRLSAISASRLTRFAACSTVLLTTLGLVKPIAAAAPSIARVALHRPVAIGEPGMTESLYQGLSWVRRHSGACDILAANYHTLAGTVDPSYFYYSAFTERRMFLEGWIETARGAYGAQPYPVRFSLVDAATRSGSSAALRALRTAGVRYVLIDRTHGGKPFRPSQLAKLAFENTALTVYRLRTSPAPC
jgi:hypothetical protein